MQNELKHKTEYGISICGDNIEILRNMPSNYVDMIITDPPYGINYQSNMHTKTEKFRKIENDNNTQRFELYKQLCRTMKANSVCCVFCSWKNYSYDYLELSKYFKIINVIIWHKPGGGIGDLRHTLSTDFEMCIVCAKGSPKIQSKRQGSVISVRKVNPNNMTHPTEKPVDLYRYIIQTWTKPGDVVLDCYAGSFVNAVACVRSKRKYICIEIDKEYYKKGIKRIENELVI